MTMPAAPLGSIWPDLPAFRELAPHSRVVPVVKRLLADSETPIGIYRKLAGDGVGTFLLESAELDGSWSRYSIIGARSVATLTARDGQAHWLGQLPAGIPESGPVLEVLRHALSVLHTEPMPGLPPFTSGLVGAVGWDAVRGWERLPNQAADELGLPEVCLALASDVVVFDHQDSTVWLIANAINFDDTQERVDAAWQDAAGRLETMTEALAAPTPSTVAGFDPEASQPVSQRTPREDYLASVRRAKEAIVDGEVFQVVVGQRFDLECQVDALDVYRMLRAANPSPYMYLVRGADADGVRFDVVGSSPEALVKLTGEVVISHPIAGTRPRDASRGDDSELAEELLADPKERAEHLMLVDLARNDLAKVCQAGTVHVVQMMDVERYSHVMHMVSTVVGTLRPDASAYEVLRATFPAGTLSGAPKPRAMELIDELEPARRGLYGGTVGYFDFAGNMDMAIAIRTAVIRAGVAHVQAGAGLVADSSPEAEDAECRAKAAAVIRAIAIAHTIGEGG